MDKELNARWRAALRAVGLSLILLLYSHSGSATGTKSAEIAHENEPWLRALHSGRLRGPGRTFIRTSCTIFDMYIDFHGGCRCLLAWEHNVGTKLGRGLGFVKDNRAAPNSLNFAFATKPFKILSINSKEVSRQRLFGECYYGVYVVGGESLHYAYLGQQKSEYDRCIARSVVNYILYNTKIELKNRSYEIELFALNMINSRSNVF